MSAASVSAADLQAFVKEVLLSRSMTMEGAEAVASALVWADLRGVGSHGVSRLPRYLEMIEQGDMNPRPAISIATQGDAFVVIDADRGAGPLAMSLATDAALERAGRVGVGVAFVKATTHTAALGFYTQRAAMRGAIGLAMAASGPIMAYHGARAAAVSTSPISIAAPNGQNDPIVFDMGTGAISLGKLVAASKSSQLLEDGWALDRNGEPTVDPQAAAIPRPVGGPKGSGLALMIEMLVSLLAANPILADSIGRREGEQRHRQNGLLIAFDVARFLDPDRFASEVGDLARAIKSLPQADEGRPVQLPGERGARVAAERKKSGIPLPAPLLAALQKIAAEAGISRSWLSSPGQGDETRADAPGA